MPERRNKPIRIDADALAEWKEAVGVPLDDGAAANSAIRYAVVALTAAQKMEKSAPVTVTP